MTASLLRKVTAALYLAHEGTEAYAGHCIYIIFFEALTYSNWASACLALLSSTFDLPSEHFSSGLLSIQCQSLGPFMANISPELLFL
jgi:hypothetical protein